MKTITMLSLLSCLFCATSISAMSLPSALNQAFIISGSKSNENVQRRLKRSATSTITRMNITSVVMSRFSRVTYASRMENELDKDAEMTFSVRLPEAAFITEFNMVVDGITFVGKVKQKEIAETEYQNAIKSGNSAGLVKADVRKTQTFDVSANVPAHSGVDFHLVYQQLLQRRHGVYEHLILVDTREVVDDFVIDVYITEKTGITKLSATGPSLGAVPIAGGSIEIRSIDADIRRSKRQAKVRFKPSGTEQRLLLGLSEKERKFLVSYDVTREALVGGELQTRNGYFVHFFAPENLPVLPKEVVFVIDRSGSMSGRKIEQTKSAFASVLNELREIDRFNIVTFSSDVTVWNKRQTVSATKENVRNAIAHVRGIRASGGTNFNEGVLKGAELLRDVNIDDATSSMVIVLTDGRPTSGVTSNEQIRLNIRNQVEGRFSVFCLGFGRDLNHDFLKRLANENDGISRQIYEDSDADLQLERFFQEVATPLLLNVKMRYTGPSVHDVSSADFDKYFSGSEIVVVGAFSRIENQMIRSVVSGTSLDGEVDFDVTGSEVDESFQHWFEDTGNFDDFIERMWAYFTIRQLLEKKNLVDSHAEIADIDNRVVSLALKYNFVTPLTSMVVTLPEDEITTQSPEPTVHPPIPLCFRRGEIIPEYATGRRIWCPYVLGERPDRSTEGKIPESGHRSRYRMTGRMAGGIGPSLHAMMPMRTAYKVSDRAATLPRRRSGGGRGKHMMRMRRPSFGRTYSYRLTKHRPAHDRSPRRWDGCSSEINEESWTFQIPDGGPDYAFLCEWDVILAEGSWIDVFVEHLNTMTNKVKITSNSKTILDHKGGVVAQKYIPVTSNKIRVVFELHPSDDQNRTGIAISYKQFVPSAERTASSPIEPLTDVFSEPSPPCGQRYTSSADKRGFVSSPQYPANYPKNSTCVWTFVNEDTQNLKLRIRFDEMDVEAGGDGHCPHDKVIVQDGAEEHVFCGYDTPAKLISRESVVKLAFISDDTLEDSGFRVRYKFLPLN